MSRLAPLIAAFVLALAALAGALAASSSGRSGVAAPHLLWQRSISPDADSTPIYLAHPGGPSCPTVSSGARRGCGPSTIYLVAGNNTDNCNPGDPVPRSTLYALDAASGRVLWKRSASGPSRCTTAAPAGDPSERWVYAPGLDGKVHRYGAVTGKESIGSGWPVTVTLMPDVEKVSANLTITGHYLYVTTSGYIGDQGHYEGHLVTVDLRTGRTHVFNTLCSNVRHLLGPSSCSSVESGLFGRGQGVTDPVTHDVYIVSGNGPWNGHTNWGDSVLKLNPSGARLIDAFTPTDQQALADADQDLGSTGPALLPTIHQVKRSYHLLVQGGKGPACGSCHGVAIRLLDRDNLSGRHGPGNLGGDLADTQSPGGCEVLTAPLVWTQGGGTIWVFYANDCGTAGYRLVSPSPGTFRLQRGWSVGTGGTTPRMDGGVLYIAHSGAVVGYDPTSGKVVWSASIGDVHWEYPLIAGHRLYIADQSGIVRAFGLR